MKSIINKFVTSFKKLLDVFPILRHNLYGLIIKSKSLKMSDKSTLEQYKNVLRHLHLEFIVTDLTDKLTELIITNFVPNDNVIYKIMSASTNIPDSVISTLHGTITPIVNAIGNTILGGMMSRLEYERYIDSNILKKIIDFRNYIISEYNFIFTDTVLKYFKLDN